MSNRVCHEGEAGHQDFHWGELRPCELCGKQWDGMHIRVIPLAFKPEVRYLDACTKCLRETLQNAGKAL